MAQHRDDPYVGFTYLIQISGLTTAGFNEVSGLDAEVEPISYRNGDEDIVARKLPGLKKFPNIVLKRGIIGDLDMFTWIQNTMGGSVDRRDGAIILRDEARNPVLRWSFKRGWACKYTGPSLKGDSSAVAIESLEICHELLSIA
ncbi:MAG TPA: phage tail protein [Polyangia bacterium]|jgi:phage tail-like protein|nr:phage tail protein [Polyangia bacterium]